MKKNIYRYGMYFLGLVILISIGGSCKEDFSGLRFDSNDKMQIYDYVGSREDLSIYKQLLDYTNFRALMSTAGTYTVFIPTNAAFNDLFEELKSKGIAINTIQDQPVEYWLDYLKYMSCDSKIKTSSMINGILDEPSLLGKDFYIVSDVRNSYKAIKLNSRATIREYDIELANGYVNIMDKVLLPPTTSIYDMLKESGNFNTLLKVFDDTGLSGYVKDSTVTVIAEPDAILQRDQFDPASMSVDELVKWAEYHIIYNQRLFDVNLDGKSIYPLFPDESQTYRVDDYGKMWLNEIYPFSETLGQGINNVAKNGIYHVLDTMSVIVKTLPGIRELKLYGETKQNADGTLAYEQNIFCEAPASMSQVEGFYNNASMAVMDSYMVGDYCWVNFPDVVKGKWTVRMIYKSAQTVDLMLIHDNEVITPEIFMNSSFKTWTENTQLNYKDMGVIDIRERGDVKLILQVINLYRVPSGCCDLQAFMVQLIPVGE